MCSKDYHLDSYKYWDVNSWIYTNVFNMLKLVYHFHIPDNFFLKSTVGLEDSVYHVVQKWKARENLTVCCFVELPSRQHPKFLLQCHERE